MKARLRKARRMVEGGKQNALAYSCKDATSEVS